MKSLFLTFIMTLAGFFLFGQIKPPSHHQVDPMVHPVPHIQPSVVIPYVHAGTGLLSSSEFSSFDYESYTRQKDSLDLANNVKRFQQRLITIDSLLANDQFQTLNETPELKFKLQYADDASIDTITIVLNQSDWFDEDSYFESSLQELNLTSLQNALKRAQYVNRIISSTHAIQVEPLNQQLEKMQINSGNDNTAYASALLSFIHQLLDDNKAKLGITDDTIYETSFEPQNNLDDKKKIAMREKFIRYVYSKIYS